MTQRTDDGTQIKFTTCYMCACRCGIKVTVENGKIRYIQGNPDHPLNQGVICAKGSAGIMKQYSPARLTRPLLRREGTERGAGQWEEISWERAYDLITERLKKIRATDPKKFAFFTGRDQMQALTSYFAKQFGTPNFAAHGGFCSVNMATSQIYSLGGTGWEFGGPDWDRTKYLIMFGVAEDHDSNPFKIGIGKLKAKGGKLVVVNPVKTGYGAVADEWMPVRPGTDGALILGMCNVLVKNKLYDEEFLRTRTNAPQLVVMDEGGSDEGMFWLAEGEEDSDQNLNWVWDTVTDSPKRYGEKGVVPALCGEYVMPDGRKVRPSFDLLTERVLTDYPVEKVAEITTIPAEQIERIALELGILARDETVTIPQQWTDAYGNHHDVTTGNPVSVHAMRGIAAHSNGFQSGRALSTMMMLLGIIDRPGGFRHKPPFPRPIPPCPKPINDPALVKPNTPLPNPPLGFPGKPEHLMVHEDGTPVRIDKAYSWEFPITAHGMLQNVITNAWKGDPYEIDTLLIFMANMAWNSSMNTSAVIEMLTDKKADGSYKIPFLISSDAFFSEQVAYSDLVLPDTTYLERHDVISLLDRPISEFDSVVDSIRQPILEPPGECEPFQETLIKLANRLGLPGFCDDEGKPKFSGYTDFITNWTIAPDTPVGFLAGWRGDGDDHIVGAPNPDQWKRYIDNGAFFRLELDEEIQWNRNINRGYLNWALDHRLIRYNEPIIMRIYSEVMQRFRLSAKGQRPGRQPATAAQRARMARYFDPLPFWYPPLEDQVVDTQKYTIHAVTQRPMPMYHAWDSQNAWLRQIIGQNFLYMNPILGRRLGIASMDWVWAESHHGRKIRVQVKYSHGVQPDTVWTWNGIGKMPGAWNLDPKAEEATKGFLLNHVISEEIDNPDDRTQRISNSDPITGQAAWYGVRLRIWKADEEGHWPEYKPLKVPAHVVARPVNVAYTTKGGN